MQNINKKIILQKLIINNFSEFCDYKTIANNMADFTAARNLETIDELWILEHNPVFTLGRNANKNNLLAYTDIPIIQTDRGGDITYHAPGQIIFYPLINLKRLQIGIKKIISILEDCIIELLNKYNIAAHKREHMPGVYIDNKKIASIGLKIKNGCTYHGVAFNYNLDLTPFSFINPCGYQNLSMTKFFEFNNYTTKENLKNDFVNIFMMQLNYAK